MRQIYIPVRKMTPKVATTLESRGLVRFLRHPGLELRSQLQDNFYKGEDFPAHIHSLHSVTITYTDIHLAYHPEGFDEIVMLWDPEPRVKPLYFVFSLWQAKEYLVKLRENALSVDDYLAFRAPINHPRWSAFIIWNTTIHCELTAKGEHCPFPSFYVLEPNPLAVIRTEEFQYGLRLSLLDS